MKKHFLIVPALFLALSSLRARADVTLPKLIGDHMVLQQEKPLPIWGWADTGEEVTVRFDETKAVAKADAQGHWQVTLAAIKADGKPHHMSISGKNKIEIDDILIGEVWIGSGQSNMEFNVASSTTGKEAIAAADRPQIRLLHVMKVQSKTPAKDVVIHTDARPVKNQPPPVATGPAWKVCSPQSVPSFAAVLYYFGVRLQKELSVPIGLIDSSWGGSPIEAWLPESGGMCNAMIAPLQPYAIRGVLWYQGETNVLKVDTSAYFDKQKTLIEGWRKGFGQDFSFYEVQIAPWGGRYEPGRLPILWECQVETLKLPHTGMAVTTDLVDNIKDIHPKDKIDVGNRLALWALAKDYKKDLVYSGPLFRSMKIDGNKIRLSFAHVGGGLKSRDGKPLSEFEIAGADGKFVPAEAAIDGTPVPQPAASIAQRRLWFIQKLVGDSPVYHNAHGIRFCGPLNSSLLHDCLRQIIARHEALRMHFAESNAESDPAPVAVVSASIAIDMPIVDLSAFPASQRGAECSRLTMEIGRKPFDLATGPLFRMTLLRISEDEHLLIFIVHHIVSDRWSVGILLGELAALYAAPAGRVLPRLSLSYTGHAAWEQARQAEPGMTAHLDYWREVLRDQPRALDLPADHSRPALPTHAGGVYACTISAELVEALARQGRQQGATPFMTFLAAFLAFASRAAAADDVIIGTPLAGRHMVQAEWLIGLFVNILPLRARVDLSQPFPELLGRVKTAVLGMLAHQEIPFDRLVEELRVERDHSRHPLFGVVFNFHNVPFSPQWAPGVAAELEEINLGMSRFDLMLTMRAAPDGGMRCEFEYSSDLFERASVERMSRHFRALLNSIVSDATLPMSRLSLLDEAERRQVLQEWSDPAPHPAAPAHCVHESFARQAALTPRAEALVCGSERLTYRQLDERANQLARRLRALGSGPGKLVAICLRRTAQLPIALLAILKSGAGYIPLDPAYPRQRLEHMLEDSRASILLTERALADLLPPTAERTVLKIDDDACAIAAESAQSLPALAGLSDLAYVIFTSGSTGRPKGVAIEHRGVAALVQWARQAFSPEEMAGMLFSTSICFDISMFELFSPLCRGGKIILAGNALELPQCSARNEVTFINTVPSAMAELIHVNGVPPSVRAIGLCGEALPAALARRCYEVPTVQAVYNIYGPTEDTVYSTAALVARDCQSAPSIGRPIAGTRALILDAQMQPVPVGINGELYLGGGKLAREYLHRPDMTAERFVGNPFGAPGERLYRTGDLCHWNADGTIQFLGRIDHQIKFRGFRIELGEIETCLGKHPAVRQCLAIVAGERVDQRLVAYVVASEQSPASSDVLRDFLAAQLPAYMVPSAFVFVPAMPMTPNGKIDRRALPAPSVSQFSASSAFVAPQGAVQEQLAEIWRDVLHLDRVGATDNFFDLGGNSLLAVRLMHQIALRTGCTLPLARLFVAPTIAQLADMIAASTAASDPAAADSDILVPLRAAGQHPPLFCVAGASGDAFTFRLLTQLLPGEQPLYALQYEEADVKSYTSKSVEKMASDFIAHIRRVRPHGPYRIAGYSFGGVVAYEIARQLAQAGASIELLALFDTFAPGTLRKRSLDHQVCTYARRLWSLGARGVLAYARERLRRFHVLPGSASSTAASGAGLSPQVRALVQTIRNVRTASVRSGRTFRPLPYQGTVTVFRSIIRSAWLEFFHDHDANGWSDLAPNVKVRTVPGDHFTMWREPNVSVLARQLMECLGYVLPKMETTHQ